MTGNVDITGNLSVSGSGNGVVFPDASKQTSAGQRKYISTVVVSPAATETDSGTALRDAIDGIIDASEDTPYLVKIEPGIYDIGTSALQMKPHVDVEGSGETVTKILGTVTGNTTGVVVSATDMELRSLTIENDSQGEYAIAIYNASGSPKLTYVTAFIKTAMVVISGDKMILNAPPPGTTYRYGIYNNTVSANLRNVTVNIGGKDYAYGIYNLNCGNSLNMNIVSINVSFSSYCYGIYNNNSSPRISGASSSAGPGNYCYGIYNVNSSAPSIFNVISEAGNCSYAYGVYNSSSGPTLTNIIARAHTGSSASYGMYNSGSANTIKADRSSFSGATNSINNDPDFTLYIGASKVDGPVDADGTWHCTQSYDGNYTAVAANCQ